jgi:glycosyltransferase involved in cell wall biosynthesis
VLCPFAPRVDGHDGGSQTMASSLLELGLRHEITLLHLQTPQEPGVCPAVADRCAQVVVVRLEPEDATRAGRRRARAARLRAALAGTPDWVLRTRSASCRRRIAELVRTCAPEVLHVEHTVMGQYLAAARSITSVLVVHDPGAAAARDRARDAGRLRRIPAVLEAAAWRRYEAGVLRRADAAVVFTDHDRRAVERSALSGDTLVRTVALGGRVRDRPLSPTGRAPLGVLFVGNFVHAPNVAGAQVLVDTIMPAVRRAKPRAMLTLVGPGPPATLVARRDEHTAVTGEVPDVAPYLDAAAVVVAPLWTGGGMRVKVLEALGAGKAVVATPLAVEGLEVVDGRQLLVRDTPETFAAAIVALLDDPAARARIAAQARAWAVERPGWDTFARHVGAVWEEALARRGFTTSPVDHEL